VSEILPLILVFVIVGFVILALMIVNVDQTLRKLRKQSEDSRAIEKLFYDNIDKMYGDWMKEKDRLNREIERLKSE